LLGSKDPSGVKTGLQQQINNDLDCPEVKLIRNTKALSVVFFFQPIESEFVRVAGNIRAIDGRI
jgi:hypothetical protein